MRFEIYCKECRTKCTIIVNTSDTIDFCPICGSDLNEEG